MSKEVDERVVEMRFNNALFESKVQQTMRSLAALNEKLMFKGAEKGFEKVSDSSEKVKFNALLNALDNLSQKFSAVEVIGVTALMRITNQAVDAGEWLVKALSLAFRSMKRRSMQFRRFWPIHQAKALRWTKSMLHWMS